MPERRNPVVRAGAILRKGGVHTKSASGQRRRQRLRIDDAIDEWFEEACNTEDAPVDPPSLHADTQNRSPTMKTGGRQKKKPGKGQPKAAPSGFGLPNQLHQHYKLSKTAILLNKPHFLPPADLCCAT